MKYNLFLTKIHKKQFFIPNKLFLGLWSVRHIVDSQILENYKIVEYHWNDSNKLNKDYIYLYNLYYKLLKNLTIKLNAIHGLKKSERFWHIITGSWLRHFLVSAFDRWECIDSAFKNYSISSIFCYKSNYHNFIPSDFSEYNHISETDVWNNHLIAEIIKYRKISNINFKENNYKHKIFKSNYQTNKFLNKKNFILSFIDSIIEMMQKKPQVVLYKNYFRLKNNLLFFFKTKTIPRLYVCFEKQIDLDLPTKDREIIKLDFDADNEFEEFIKENLFRYMPLTYLESFKKLSEYCKKILTKPKIIISATGCNNDIFSHWTAQKIYEKSNYFISEHGGCLEDTPRFDYYLKVSDYFLSWNHSEKKKSFQISPFFYTKKINKINLKLGEEIYIILSHARVYNHIVQYALKSSQLIYAYNSLKKIKKLPNHIKKKIKFRLHPHSKDWFLEDRIKLDFGIDKLNKFKKIDDCFFKAKIIIHMDFQTSFYESMNSQKPVLVFTERKFTKNINPRIVKLFEKFVAQKIIFTNIDELILHINYIWEDPLKWWNSEEIVTLRDEFNILCSKKNNKNFVKEIVNLINSHEKK